MTKDKDFFKFDLELTDKEIHFIGQIVSQWGALEYEIFNQTLLTFDCPEEEDVVLPREMNNLQFTGILRQWKERVVDRAEGEKSEILKEQHDQILELKEFREALVHGMWKWSPSNINQITTVRIRKKKIVSINFTADDLYDFYSRIAAINFKIRFPGGVQDIASQRAEQGGYFSRRFLSMITDNDIKDDWLSTTPDKNEKTGD